MRSITRCRHLASALQHPIANASKFSVLIYQKRLHASANTHLYPSYTLKCLDAPHLSLAQELEHVRQVSQQLEQTGMLKIKLGFPDDDSNYLKHLLQNLNKHHHHQLPITHSATRGWFWDVRPNKTNFQAGDHQARSETMNDFPWHTDCSYEDPPPRYFALQVLQHDRYGGGTLSVMNVERLCEFLSPTTQAALKAPEYCISTPAEFIKDPTRKGIIGPVFSTNSEGQSTMIRFREDILSPLTDRAARALEKLKEALAGEEVQMQSTVHLKSTDLPKGSIILMDNRRWLHARNHINDPERHLRRVRWDACPFGDVSARNV
ncbi:taurine catabolism dioxygenase [Colletotrichum truncatum]|uniref:Taurine catabolism dioxygenase n=1 Tax=Colletotrichum truncatum TaxID=5467 RepID=A0ACC3ZH33_COLTU|nr:taurine catabolism dioxygenase [Colletotrichum truncatum]KAF6790505.1 taurine catabolism dioxygenase [Colletotrichum truncatum]